MQHESRHQCLIYEGSPSHKLKLVATILQRKLNEGYRCLYLNSAPMVAGMRSTLAAMGVNVASEVSRSAIILSSETVPPGEEFESDVMLAKLEDFLEQSLKDGYKGLWASGDMTFELGPKKDFSKLLEYESKLEEMIQRRKELCGVCQYHCDTLPKDILGQGLLVHANIILNETLTIVNPYYERSPSSNALNASNNLDEIIRDICKQ
jgi:MEDS: MEthanogen/methylotroph, DcmR Sensory domain